ncbi:ABC transporter ATP-binding protein [Paenibacillus sp. SYP-B4298]|uniref:ABC transporter ATP-binding protein n=1 Tax=Paenibacillus sp. SYP-B4298 TaxID=2996034 RepID=UPI0022DDEF70|nr:ABC transporter ATP-binding protein [Paenibacillus sp. SYP-B4298]
MSTADSSTAASSASGSSAAARSGSRTSLAVHSLSYAFKGGPALFDSLSFEVLAGEFVALLAPSGVGKTTLFRLLAGLLEPQAGSIVLAGEDGDGDNAVTSKRQVRRIGYMPQRDCLMPWRSVIDNAALGLELAGVPRREARRQVSELLPSFGLEGAGDKRPHELSGGMRQRVSFLRSLLSGGDPLLLDEPFSALDAMTRTGMQEWLLQIWEQHRKTVLFITHDVDEALLLSDRVLVASASPISRLSEFVVDVPRPRTYSAVLEPSFLQLKRAILEQLGHASAVRGGEG